MSDTLVTDTVTVVPDSPKADGVTLTQSEIENIRQFAPELTAEDLADLDEDQLQIFKDLNTATSETMSLFMELNESAQNGGPGSLIGFIKQFMLITNTGVGELSTAISALHAKQLASTKVTKKPRPISRLRVQSILDETVEATLGEISLMSDVLLARWERWKAIQNKPTTAFRRQQRAEKRAAKKAKKNRR